MDLDRRKLGTFYTPSDVASSLAAWAIRSPRDVVLEPSFGGCSFLAAAISRFSDLGFKNGARNIYGFDVDPVAFEHLSRFTAVDVHKFKRENFLTAQRDFQVDCVIGNPPYVRHHRYSEEELPLHIREELQISGRTDLWCAFLLRAASFLKPGGRLAFVVPAAFLFADYASPARDFLRDQFREVKVIQLAYQTFKAEGADERGVVIAAEGYGLGKCDSWSSQVAWSAPDLEQLLRSNGKVPLVSSFRSALTDSMGCVLFGDIAEISIGVVTGYNRHFVISASTAGEHSLSASYLYPILSRSRHLHGLQMTHGDFKALKTAGESILLVSPTRLGTRHGPLRNYLALVPRNVRRDTLWLRKRPLWFAPDLPERSPDAVVPCMNHTSPRLVLLPPGINSTNALHGVRFRKRLRASVKKAIALSMLTSFGQLAAEIYGRPYGGGVLKIEPGSLRQFPIPQHLLDAAIDVDRAFSAADLQIRRGNFGEATRIADEAILNPVLGVSASRLRQDFAAEVRHLRGLRLGLNESELEGRMDAATKSTRTQALSRSRLSSDVELA